MDIILAQLLTGIDSFESVEVNSAIGAGGLTALLLGLGYWLKRSLPVKFRKWIPHALLVIGMVVFVTYSGFNLSTFIFAFLASNAAVGIYEGSKAPKAAVGAVKAARAAKK